MKAREFRKKQLEVARELRDAHLQIKAIILISRIYHDLSEFAESMSYLDTGLELLSNMERDGENSFEDEKYLKGAGTCILKADEDSRRSLIMTQLYYFQGATDLAYRELVTWTPSFCV